jgi:hypothetical protein
MLDVIDEDPALDFDRRYVFGALHAGHLAKTLGIPRIAFLEFGTGRGGGADKLERLADQVEKRFGVEVVVRTFDIGTGVPDAASLADLPQLMGTGGYADFDDDVIRGRFRRPSTELLLGTFADSVSAYLERPDEPPVGFLMFDVGVHSGTADGLRVIRDARPEQLLPRVQCYFGPILVYTYAWFNGGRLAIDEHNHLERSQEAELGWRRPLSPIYGLRYFAPRRLRDEPWVEVYYLAHVTDHPRYAEPDGLLRYMPSALSPNDPVSVPTAS